MCNELFTDTDIEQTCAFLSGLGYEGIELAPYTFAPQGVDRAERAAVLRVRRAAEHAGLQVVGLHWLLLGPEGVHLTAADAAVRRRTSSYLEALVECCAELGGTVLVLGSPKQRNLPPATSRDEGMRRAAEVLEPAVRRAAGCGVRWALEPLPAQDTSFLQSLDECLLLDALLGGGPALGVQLDVKSLCAETADGRDPGSVVLAHSGAAARFVHLHANDRNLCGPGEGDTDFTALFGALRRVGYDGWVSIEAFRAPLGIEHTATAGLTHLRATLAAAERGT